MSCGAALYEKLTRNEKAKVNKRPKAMRANGVSIERTSHSAALYEILAAGEKAKVSRILRAMRADKGS